MRNSLTRVSTVAGLLALALPLAATGCGSGGGKADQADLGTITMMVPLVGLGGTGSGAPDKNGELQKAIEKYIGKKLDITWVPNSDYGDRTNVVIASGKMPEVTVMQGKTPAFVQAAQAGAFWDLTGKLGKYPNLTAQNKQILLNSSVNGKNYGIFRLRDPMRTAVMVRKDWLARLHLAMPETVDDLYNVAKAFTNNDPDGDGKKDTYGLVLPKWPGGYASASPYDVIETWFGAPNGWGERDGKLVPGFDTPQFLAADRFIKKMVSEKLVNPDFATLDSAKWNDPFFTGRGGIIIDQGTRVLSLLKLFQQKYPNNFGDYVAMNGNLLGPDGQRHSYPTVGYAGLLAISKQSVPTEAELDDVLSTLDKLSAKPGQILLNNGIEGRNFAVQDGFAAAIKSTDPAIKTLSNDSTSFGQLGTQSNGYLAYTVAPASDPERALLTQRTQLAQRDLGTAVNNPALALVSTTYTQKGAVLDQIVADARVKYFAGQLDDQGLQAEIKRWYSEGGQQVVDEMNTLHAKVK